MISVIVPVYNEENVILGCLNSLSKQNNVKMEIILVDDGSTDQTVSLIENYTEKHPKIKITLLKQNHQGPGLARNLGVSKAVGSVLVFVDADMEFEPDFLEKLTEPILRGKVVGTFSKEEYLLNRSNALARCWNLNFGRKAEKMIPDDYPDQQEVFRAIKKEEFEKICGFDVDIGYTDDWSLSRKLGTKAVVSLGAIYYHRNPETFKEIWKQARWFGKNEFLTGNFIRKIYNICRYNPVLSLFKGFFGAVQFKEKEYLVFKVVFDTAVFTSVVRSFFGEKKSK